MIGILAIILAVAAEALVGYTLGEFIAGVFDLPGTATAVTFASVALVAFALPRAIAVAGIPPNRALALTAVVAFVTIYLPIRIQFAGDVAFWDLSWIFEFIGDAAGTLEGSGAPVTSTLLLIGVWARSTWRSMADIELELTPRSLAIPLAVVTGVLIIGAATDGAGEVSRAALAFYAVALLALACSQLALSGATYGDLRTGETTAVLLGGAAIATFIGVLIFGPVFALTVRLLEPVVTGPLASGLVFIMELVLTPPVWLLSEFFEWLLGDQAPLQDDRPTQTPEDGEPQDPATDGDRSLWADVLFIGLRVLLVLGGLALLVGLFLLLARLRRQYVNARGARPESEAIGSAGGDLLGAFRSLFSRERRAAATGSPAVVLYLDVLDEAREAGIERAPGQTPREFDPALERAFRDPVTAEITTAFIEARYASRRVDEGVIDRLRSRWESRQKRD